MSNKTSIKCPNNEKIKFNSINFFNAGKCNTNNISNKYKSQCDGKNNCSVSVEQANTDECSGYDMGIQYSCVDDVGKSLTNSGKMDISISTNSINNSGNKSLSEVILESKNVQMDKLVASTTVDINSRLYRLNGAEMEQGIPMESSAETASEHVDINLVQNQEESSTEINPNNLTAMESVMESPTIELPYVESSNMESSNIELPYMESANMESPIVKNENENENSLEEANTYINKTNTYSFWNSNKGWLVPLLVLLVVLLFIIGIIWWINNSSTTSALFTSSTSSVSPRSPSSSTQYISQIPITPSTQSMVNNTRKMFL
ncbi:MAG: hypothetical protein Homavirus36_5 [Homavirus sp.]|uniref:Uncharacterized protein n=1 Tax=Homavirus sp. TaxID=2487769 RepID=A0A3G5A534_9VIRU|nr:MAG: hypothetical protein Homavirus36_5 [Homavirus sp.]